MPSPRVMPHQNENDRYDRSGFNQGKTVGIAVDVAMWQSLPYRVWKRMAGLPVDTWKDVP